MNFYKRLHVGSFRQSICHIKEISIYTIVHVLSLTFISNQSSHCSKSYEQCDLVFMSTSDNNVNAIISEVTESRRS